MRKITVLCVGKLKERFYAEACAEYQKRLSRCCKLEVLELPEQRLGDAPSPAEIARALDREADALRERLPKGGTAVALCVEGESMSSERFSRTLSELTAKGGSQLSFLIGGSFGLAGSIKRECALRLSFSPMTFPHHLARVLLLEQLYRAFQIEQGTKYHK